MADNDDAPIGDQVLAVLYKSISATGGELGVSLLVGGSWVSGILCSARTWFEQVAHLVDENSEGGFGMVFRQLGRFIYPTEDEIEAGVADQVDEDRPIGFLHLRDARVISASGSVPTDNKGFLRLRLEQVDGWMIGALGEPGYTPPPPSV